MVNGNKETLKKVDENTQIIAKKISSERTVSVSTIEDKSIDIPMEEINDESSDSETEYVVAANQNQQLT